MTVQERLKNAAQYLLTNRGKIQLSDGQYLDDLLLEAAREMDNLYRTFGRVLLDRDIGVEVNFNFGEPNVITKMAEPFLPPGFERMEDV